MGKRALAIYATLILMFTGMLCRMYTLSMGETLASAAHTQSAFLLDVDRTRGLIYDCQLRPLVGTREHTVAAVQPSPEAFTALTEAIQEDGERFQLDTQATKPYTVTLENTEIYSRGIEMFDVVDRYAPEQLAPHIIGYLSPDRQNGVAGIELAYDSLLKQYDGSLQLRYMMDATGRTMTTTVPEILQENYKNPGGVVLTIDARFQRAAQNAMRHIEKGAAVVMDVNTGDIKASVSMPAYDPDNLAASLKDPNSPFVNRAFSQYSVGSTFKLVTAAAALEAGYGPYVPHPCLGYEDVDGHIFYCGWRNGHGEIALEKAMEVSCNPFFINMGLNVGGKRIASLARELGFTRAAEFADDISTQSGTLPSEAELNNPADVANMSFGQGRLTATPIQIAQMMSAVANGGYAVTPRLIEGFTDDGEAIYEYAPAYTPSRAFSKRTSDILRETMVNNVINGSGKLAKPNYGLAGGKTGSAQTGVFVQEGTEQTEIVHAWFAGYYPAQEPQYAIVVLVEGGNSGSDIAAPIFREIANEIYLAQI